jgi:hypothetical protein
VRSFWRLAGVKNTDVMNASEGRVIVGGSEIRGLDVNRIIGSFAGQSIVDRKGSHIE